MRAYFLVLISTVLLCLMSCEKEQDMKADVIKKAVVPIKKVVKVDPDSLGSPNKFLFVPERERLANQKLIERFKFTIGKSIFYQDSLDGVRYNLNIERVTEKKIQFIFNAVENDSIIYSFKGRAKLIQITKMETILGEFVNAIEYQFEDSINTVQIKIDNQNWYYAQFRLSSLDIQSIKPLESRILNSVFELKSLKSDNDEYDYIHGKLLGLVEYWNQDPPGYQKRFKDILVYLDSNVTTYDVSIDTSLCEMARFQKIEYVSDMCPKELNKYFEEISKNRKKKDPRIHVDDFKDLRLVFGRSGLELDDYFDANKMILSDKKNDMFFWNDYVRGLYILKSLKPIDGEAYSISLMDDGVNLKETFYFGVWKKYGDVYEFESLLDTNISLGYGALSIEKIITLEGKRTFILGRSNGGDGSEGWVNLFILEIANKRETKPYYTIEGLINNTQVEEISYDFLNSTTIIFKKKTVVFAENIKGSSVSIVNDTIYIQ